MVITEDYNLKNKYANISDYDKTYSIINNKMELGYIAVNLNTINMIYIYIDESYRGNGFGTKAFDEIIKQLKENGTKRISLLFDVDNIRMKRIVSKYNIKINSKNNMMVNCEILL